MNSTDPDGLADCPDKDPNKCTVTADPPPPLPTSAAKIAQTWENAGKAAQSMVDAARIWLSAPRNMSCLVGGTLAGANVGLRAGATAGLAGGPLGEISVPGGALGGAIIGGGVGWAAGMGACKTGSGSGGSAGGGSGRTGPKWKFGSNKSAAKWASQMRQRGWSEAQIDEAIEHGAQYPETNNVNPGNGATRFVNPTTGRSVVLDNVTREVLHVGGTGFRY